MRSIGIAAIALLGGCVSMVPPPVVRAPPVPLPVARPVPRAAAGLDRVLGRDEAALVALLGKPDAEVREGAARKLQFAGPFCVLDAYLYPMGAGAPRVTHIDARQHDGSGIDQASCVAALSRREGGR